MTSSSQVLIIIIIIKWAISIKNKPTQINQQILSNNKTE